MEHILSVISEDKGARKTKIMYKAYLSYNLLNKYLNDVLKAGLVVCDNNSYRLTSKGRRFLDRFGEYHRSREVVNESLNNVEDQKLILEEMCQTRKALNTGLSNVKRNKN